MIDLNDENPIEPALTVPLTSKRSLWIMAVIGVITAHMLAVLVSTGMDYLYNILPQEAYARIYDRQWVGMNVRNMSFQSPKEFKAAQQKLEHHANAGPEKNNPIPHYLLAELYNSLNQPQKAVSQYQIAIHNAESNWLNKIQYQQFTDNAHAALAIIYYEQGKTVRAQQEINSIADADENREAGLLSSLKDSLEAPERGDFHLLLGKEFRRELKLGMATKELQQAESLSQSPQLRMEAVNFLKTQMPQGVQDLSPMARYYGLAARSAQTNDENLPRAASLFQKAIHENPDFDWGYNELAIIYRELKDYPKAIAYAQNAITQNADFYNPYLTLGDIALDKEDYKAAIGHFQTAKAILQRLPLDDQQAVVANIENQIAYSYESMRDYSQATRHYQSALTLSSDTDIVSDEDYTYAQDGIARIAEARKQNAGKSKDGEMANKTAGGNKTL